MPFSRKKQPGLLWLSVAILGGVALAMLVLGLMPALGAGWHFHPGRDPLWRGFAAQLVHLGSAHLFLNLLGLSILGGLAHQMGRLSPLPGCLILSATAVCLGLQNETPPLAWYVGLSGALYGVAGWLALEQAFEAASRFRRLLALLIGVGIGAKACLGGGSLLADLPVATSAHLYGFIGGLGYTAISQSVRLYREHRRRPV